MPAISNLLPRRTLRLPIRNFYQRCCRQHIETRSPITLLLYFCILLATNCSQISMLQMTVGFYRVTRPYSQTLSRKYKTKS